MDVQQIVALIFGFLGGATGLKLITGFWHLVTGRARRKRDEVDRAWDRADREAVYRRRLQEHTSRLRRIITEAPCLTPDVLPPEPVAPESTGPIRASPKVTA